MVRWYCDGRDRIARLLGIQCALADSLLNRRHIFDAASQIGASLGIRTLMACLGRAACAVTQRKLIGERAVRARYLHRGTDLAQVTGACEIATAANRVLVQPQGESALPSPIYNRTGER